LRNYFVHWFDDRRRHRGFATVREALAFINERDLARRVARVTDTDFRTIISEAELLRVDNVLDARPDIPHTSRRPWQRQASPDIPEYPDV
jgi:hypothetical protein